MVRWQEEEDRIVEVEVVVVVFFDVEVRLKLEIISDQSRGDHGLPDPSYSRDLAHGGSCLLTLSILLKTSSLSRTFGNTVVLLDIVIHETLSVFNRQNLSLPARI